MESGEEKRGGIYFVYIAESAELNDDLWKRIEARNWTILESREFFDRRLDVEDRVLVRGPLDFLKQAVKKAEAEGFALGFFPSEDQKRLAGLLDLGGSVDERIEVLESADPQPVDLLYARDELVVYNAVVGDAPPFSFRIILMNDSMASGKWEVIWESIKELGRMRRVKSLVSTAKGQQFKTVLTGAILFNQRSISIAARLVDEPSYNDGMLRAILISPRSLVSYLHHIFVTLFPSFRQQSLPGSVGLIKTQEMKIECDPPLKVTVDGKEIGKTPMDFSVHPKALRFCAGERFWQHNQPTQASKETVRIDNLPQSEEALSYAQKRLPLLNHASEQEYRELFASLREDAKINGTYIVLMIFSTLLATVGLFLNSASVVIGAMLLAPLMQPIVSFAMGILRWDASLAYRSIKTVLAGVGLVLVSSMIVAWILPFDTVTQEMAGRLHPTLLDLTVAVVSGMAAAYAKKNAKVSGSLVGVAIAVALVPPLSTAGIGLGWGSLSMFFNAFLLFLTNLVGIVLAAGLVFMLMGFSPIRRAKKGLTFGLVFVILVSIPLTFSFRQMVYDAQLKRDLQTRVFHLGNKSVEIGRLELRHIQGRDLLVCDLVVSSPLKKKEIQGLKMKIEKIAKQPLQLEFVQRIRI